MSSLMDDELDPKQKGELAEAKVLPRLIEKGYTVSKPFGENSRYDYVVDDGDELHRVQVKKGSELDGEKFQFSTCSTRSNCTGVDRESYDGDIEAFVVWFDGSVYWVPIEDVPSTEMYLRLEEPDINRSIGINMAEDYRLD